MVTVTEALGETQETRQQTTVRVERSVRYNRLLLLGTLAGAVLGALISTLFPVAAEGNYTAGQIAGFSAVLGGAVGLLVMAIVALILGAAAKNKRGTAAAVHTKTVIPGADSGAEAVAEGSIYNEGVAPKHGTGTAN